MTKKKTNVVIKERKPLLRTNKPVKLPDNVTWLKQPNIITLMSCDLSKMQMRAVIIIVEALQDDINKRIGGTPFAQLSLFKDEDEDKIVKLSIPIRNFGVKPNHYPELRNAIKDLAKIPVEIDVVHPDTGEATFNTSLLSAIIPLEGSQRKNVIFRIEREVAKCLVQVDLSNGLGYTNYIKEIALTARSKYTIRMYMLIASWRDKGGFSMEVPKFKHWLQIDETEYTDWKDIEKRVIKTAEEELHEKADIWFHYSPVYDQDVSLKVPYKIDFKVIRSAKDGDKQIVDNAKRAILQILQNGRLSSQKCSNIIDAMTIYNYHLIRDKVIDLFMYINANKKGIRDPAEYAYTSMMKYIENIENE
jgi:hypothetical protein